MMAKINKPLSSTTTSPCIRNCCLNEDDICLGCFRHIDEITGWHSMNKQQQQAVLELCQQRRIIRQQRFNNLS